MPPNLRSITIVNCENLLSDLTWPSMDKLTDLTICGPCDGIKSFPKEGLLPTSLTYMCIYRCSSLETLDCRELIHLTSLQKLIIIECQKLENMTGDKLPESLIKLEIGSCPLLQKRMKHHQIWTHISLALTFTVDGLSDQGSSLVHLQLHIAKGQGQDCA
ncbi:hypothetical protein Fmac_012306 [Flemingia macrophylla]|uniref:CC-NBS-LRR protein n=1 Tax=Flemingia macrophylla TaxID=520843 RepID=A0ABD1MPW9_9FABA